MAGLGAFFLVWQAVPMLGGTLPPPSHLPLALWRELEDGSWQAALQASLCHYLIGVGIGTGLGVSLGIASALSHRLEAGLGGVVRLLRSVPALAWVPFAILWFGLGQPAAVFIIASAVLWINHHATATAVRAVDGELLEMAGAFGQGGRWPRLVKVILPGAADGILAGVRSGLGQAWLAAIAVELVGCPGLGQRMMQVSTPTAGDVVLVYLVTIAVLFWLTNALFVRLRDRLLAWQP